MPSQGVRTRLDFLQPSISIYFRFRRQGEPSGLPAWTISIFPLSLDSEPSPPGPSPQGCQFALEPRRSFFRRHGVGRHPQEFRHQLVHPVAFPLEVCPVTACYCLVFSNPRARVLVLKLTFVEMARRRPRHGDIPSR